MAFLFPNLQGFTDVLPELEDDFKSGQRLKDVEEWCEVAFNSILEGIERERGNGVPPIEI